VGEDDEIGVACGEARKGNQSEVRGDDPVLAVS